PRLAGAGGPDVRLGGAGRRRPGSRQDRGHRERHGGLRNGNRHRAAIALAAYPADGLAAAFFWRARRRAARAARRSSVTFACGWRAIVSFTPAGLMTSIVFVAVTWSTRSVPLVPSGLVKGWRATRTSENSG